MKFAIDPGHGAYPDTGAEGFINEQNCALAIANSVISKLQALGHTAFNVRPSSVSSVVESLQKRCDASSSADYLVSIHLNAGGGKGSEVFAMSTPGKELANKVLTQLVNLGFVNRGVKDGSSLYVIKHSNPVAILIEVCFVDTQSDTQLYNGLGVDKIASAIVQGLTGKVVSSYPGYLIKYNANYDKNVVLIQQKLGITTDGYFGTNTLIAVQKFQKASGLQPDGIIGELTWKKLFN